MTKHSLNFRSTAGSWAETGDNGAILGDAYPVVRGGLTCGWSAASITKADYAGATDAKLSGRNSVNSGTYFRIDLPNGPGVYRIWMSCGALSSTLSMAFLIRDGAGSVITSSGSTSINGNGSPSLAQVMDATATVIDYSTYLSTSGGTYVEFTATQDHIRIERNAGIAIYMNNIQLEPQSTPLYDAVLSNDTDTGTHSGALLPKQPAGHGIGKLSAVTGTQAFSISSGGTYFALETRSGATWLVTNSTRIPDGWTGAVTIRQTSAGVTHDTVVNFTAATVSRPVTGALGRITTETFLKRKEVLDVVDGELWAGYTGQAFVSDQTSNSYADIVSTINALTPNGTGWYRIRVQNGSWTGNGLNLTQLDFGTGGLLIEPDTGHDPVLKCEFRNFRMRKCHVRGITFVPWSTDAGKYVFTAGIPAQTSNSIMKFSENKFGAYFDAGFDLSNHGNWSDCLGFEFVEQINVVNNTIIGVRNFASVTGGRIMNFRNNQYQYVRQDFHALSTAFRFSTPRGVFADDLTYAVLKDNTAWNNIDGYTGIAGGATPHGDWVQIRRTTDGGYAYPTTSAGLNGSSTAPWTIDTVGFNPVANRLYKVVAITGSALLDVANQPTGTGTGIVSGNVTFDFLQEYNLGTTMKMLLESNAILQDGVSINTEGNAQPNCQFIINSNSNLNNIHHITAIDNICASASSRGIDADTADGDIWAEYNTFVGGAEKALQNDQAMINGRNTRTRGNIIGIAAGGLNLTGLESLQSEKNIGVDWKSSSVSPYLPAENLKGGFTNYGATGWGYPITDDGTQTAEQMRSALSKTLHHLTGAAGARLTEKHTITVTDSLGATVTFNLDVAPTETTAASGVPFQSVNADGWTVTYASPPTFTTPQSFSVTRQGYDASAAAVSVVDTVYCTGRLRNPYPSQATLTSDRVVLSDHIYTPDTLSDATNSSGRAYPKPCALWLEHDYFEIVNSTFSVNLVVAHKHARNGRPVAAVKIKATDGTTTRETLVTGLTFNSYNTGLGTDAFRATFTSADFAVGAEITVSATIYPWVGAAYDLATDGNAAPHMANTVIRGYRVTPVYAYLSATGNNATAVASTNAATAAASPYLTIAAAAAGVQAFNNANYGRNEAGGGVLRFPVGTWVLDNTGTGAIPVTTACIVYEAINSADKATTILADAGSTRSSANIAPRALVRNVTLKKMGANTTIFRSSDVNTATLAFQNCNVDVNGQTVYGAWVNRVGRMWMTNVAETNGASAFADVFGSLIKNVVAIGCSTDSNTSAISVIASRHSALNLGYKVNISLGRRFSIVQNNVISGSTALFRVYIDGIDLSTVGGGMAFIGNVVEAWGSGSGGVSAWADGNTQAVYDFIFANNTLPGASDDTRFNRLYSDVAGATLNKDMMMSYNVMGRSASKTDVFAADGTSIGNWPAAMSVSHSYNSYIEGRIPSNSYTGAGSWRFEIEPIGAQIGDGSTGVLNPLWVSDASKTGTNLGGGDYRPQSGSPLIKVPAGKTITARDALGTTIPTDGTAFVGALQA